MSPHEAQRVIDALADGVDPETGEILPQESVLQHASVIRALFVASRALAHADATAKIAKPSPSQAGKPWSPDEDQRLLAAFDQDAGLDALTAAHGRSRGGIASRLVRLGRIQERAEIHARGAAREAPAAP